MLETAALFGDGMVIQRDRLVWIWGTAGAGASVRAVMQNRTAECTADGNGLWRLCCGPFRASASEEMILSSGGETLRIRDVAVGEVWLAGGQSNLPWTAIRSNQSILKEISPE